MTQSLLPKIPKVPEGTTFDLVEHDFSRGEPANRGSGLTDPCLNLDMFATQVRGGPRGLWTSPGVSNSQVRRDKSECRDMLDHRKCELKYYCLNSRAR